MASYFDLMRYASHRDIEKNNKDWIKEPISIDISECCTKRGKYSPDVALETTSHPRFSSPSCNNAIATSTIQDQEKRCSQVFRR